MILVSANRNFFALYTNKQLLHVFSSSTTELLKRGIIVEGVCMIESNSAKNLLALLTLKGKIIIYEVINPDYPSIDSVKIKFETSIQQLLKNSQQKISNSNEEGDKKALSNQALVHV